MFLKNEFLQNSLWKKASLAFKSLKIIINFSQNFVFKDENLRFWRLWKHKHFNNQGDLIDFQEITTVIFSLISSMYSECRNALEFTHENNNFNFNKKSLNNVWRETLVGKLNSTNLHYATSWFVIWISFLCIIPWCLKKYWRYG